MSCKLERGDSIEVRVVLNALQLELQYKPWSSIPTPAAPFKGNVTAFLHNLFSLIALQIKFPATSSK